MTTKFNGKAYDSVALIPAYAVAGLITNTMDTDDRYPVTFDAKIAVLTNSAKHEVAGMFHVLDVSAVHAHLEALGVSVDTGTTEDHARGIAPLTFSTADRKVEMEAICYTDLSTGLLMLIADIETVTIQLFSKYPGDDEWEASSNKINIGFKKSDPTGYFITEMSYDLGLMK